MRNKVFYLGTIVLLLVISLVAPVVVAEAAYPEKPLEVVYHAKAGGGGSMFLNALGKAVEPKLGQAWVVNNMPGSAGATAWTYVAKAKPDGYTLLGTSSNIITTPVVTNMPVSYKDFEPIAMLFIDSMVIFTSTDSPYETLEMLVEEAKKKPGQLKFSGGGAGGLEHVAIHKFCEAADVNIPTVPFEGGGDIVVSVMGGHMDVGVEDYGVVAPNVEAGKLRILATYNKMDDHPEIPSLDELGYKGIELEKMRGIVAPKGLPEEIKEYLIEVLKTAYDDPDFQKYYKSNSLTPKFRAGEDFRNAMDRQYKMVSEFYKK